ncbi:hypothetical protein N7519_000516 [Penicillium mononematosum]|uniref:uncharacterized protein n=1 Tax=Penicillium mononematosum TaxID=268346 RepID=UPI00254700A7|nr:uncharacterized protein N7519_000516 [Penicillium mononematosum]KAJ6190495.1 hypothetical protein N7519_000516 [Penicillium mononematosum]
MAEFDDQHSRVPESVFLGVLWALTGTSFLFVIFRIYAQLASFRRVFLDGYLVVFAWVIMLTAAVIWQVEGKVLYELYAISTGTKPFNLEFLPRYNTFMRFNAPLQILFYSALWCVKFSFMALFYRISAKVRSLRIWWFVVLFCTASVYIASVADIEYKCSLGGLEYIITQCPQPHHVHYENRMFWANCAGDVITDLMILSIPFLVLWKTRISLRKKLILLSIFSATNFIMVTAIIRVTVGMNYDRQMNIDWLCFWSFVEVDVAIIVSCVASLRQLFVASQNQSSSAKAAYHDTNEPILKKSKEGSSQDLSRSVGDVESPANDEAPMSPLSIVHVRQDFEVTRDNASQSANVYFASEVEAFLLGRVKFCDAVTPSTTNAEPEIRQIRWKDLPYDMKRVYLRRKLQIHGYSQCGWSSLVHRILDLPHQGTETRINQLIDGYLCGGYTGYRKLLDPALYAAKQNEPVSARRIKAMYWPPEELQMTSKYAIAASAIQRGDCIQLQRLLDQGIHIAGYSDRLALVPLDVAAKKGSKATIELLLAHGCPMTYRSHKDRHNSMFDETRVTDTMAESGNDIGLKVWIEYLVKEGPMYPKLLKRTMVRGVVGGHVEVLKLVQEKYEALYGNPGWGPHMLDQAIRSGSLDAIKYLFHRGEVDAHTRTSPSDRRPLLKLLHECPIQKRPDIVRFLLENGAHPNGNNPPKKRTPFEVAVKEEDFESASILLKYGAAVNFKRMMPLLLKSSEQTCAALTQLLWPGDSRRVYEWGGKLYALCREAKMINNVEDVFLELGWSEQDVKGLGIDHFIDVW